MTHPSYKLYYGTNPDHVRNSLYNCGIRFKQDHFESQEDVGEGAEERLDLKHSPLAVQREAQQARAPLNFD